MSEASPGLKAASPRYAINRAIFDLSRRPDARAVISAKADFLAQYELEPAERRALLGPEWQRLLELGALPNLVYRYYMLHGLAPESFSAAVAAQR